MTSTRVRALMLGAALVTLAGSAHAQARVVRLSRAELQDKIRSSGLPARSKQ